MFFLFFFKLLLSLVFFLFDCFRQTPTDQDKKQETGEESKEGSKGATQNREGSKGATQTERGAKGPHKQGGEQRGHTSREGSKGATQNRECRITHFWGVHFGPKRSERNVSMWRE